jgi:hypothetical protein
MNPYQNAYEAQLLPIFLTMFHYMSRPAVDIYITAWLTYGMTAKQY